MQEVFAAAPFIVLVVLYALLRFRPVTAFWGLCFGVITAQLIDGRAVGKILAPYTGPVTANEVALFALLVPLAAGVLLTARQSEPFGVKALPQLVVLFGVASLLLLQGVNYLDPSLQTHVRSGEIWKLVLSYGVFMVIVAGVVGLMQLVTLKRRAALDDKHRK